MSESQKVWKRVKQNLPGRWLRIENRVDVGTPDCLCLMETGVVSWVELKLVRAGWPARHDTAIDLGLRPAQVFFLQDWVKKGGRAYLLARVEKEGGGWLLIPGERIIDKDTKAGWLNRAAWSGPVANWQAIAAILGHVERM